MKKKVIKLIKPYLKLEVIGLFFTILYSASVFLTPIASEYLIDHIMKKTIKSDIEKGLVIFFLICISQPVFLYIKSRIYLHVSEQMVYDLRAQTYFAVMGKQYLFFEKNSKGEVLSRLTNDIRLISDFLTNEFANFIKDIAVIILVFIGMMLQSFEITILIFLMYFFYYLYNLFMSYKFKSTSNDSLNNYDELCKIINQSLDNVVLIKSNALIDRVTVQFKKIIKQTQKINIQLGKLGINLETLSGILIVSTLIVIYAIGTLKIANGTMTLGGVIALGLYFQLVSAPISEVSNIIVHFKETEPSFERIFGYLETETDDEINHNKEIIFGTAEENEIRFEDISFSYCDNKVFDHLSFVLKDGLNVIIGNSGAGKSTIFKLILGLYTLDSGRIVINSKSYINMDNISYVSQDVLLLNDTIKMNLTLGRDVEISIMNDVCKKVGILDKINNFENKYETILNERSNISGGEKQRVAIARAILRDSKIMLLDEVTSDLDSNSRKLVLKTLKDISCNKIVVLVTHDLTALRYADNSYVLEENELRII